MSNYVIEARGLCKTFAKKQVLSNFSVQIEKGGVHAIVGSNGAGKSTLFRVLLGFLSPSAGESFVLNENSKHLSARTRGLIGYVDEEHTLPRWLKVSALKNMQKAHYPDWNEDIYRKVVVNFDVNPDQKIGSLSKGERAGLNLAMALAQKPELLILDEPTLGIDVVAKQEFLDAVLFCTETDCTVIYCSHQMEEVERLSDQLIIMEKGELKTTTSPDAFNEVVQLWVVDASDREKILGEVTEILDTDLIEDKFHIYVLDSQGDLADRLMSLGIDNPTRIPIGLDTAVRAYLRLDHTGNTAMGQ